MSFLRAHIKMNSEGNYNRRIKDGKCEGTRRKYWEGEFLIMTVG